MSVENIVKTEQNAGDKQFLLFPLHFQICKLKFYYCGLQKLSIPTSSNTTVSCKKFRTYGQPLYAYTENVLIVL